MKEPFETFSEASQPARSDKDRDEPSLKENEAEEQAGDQRGANADVSSRDAITSLRDAEAALEATVDRNGAHTAPLHEIATAFRMNAEALHTLKLMQSDLADSVRRGDRSQLVVQSTRALNDTFRNLSAVQRELLGRLDATRPSGGASRSPVVPLLLLGLLVVLLGGIYVVLDAVDRKAPATAVAPPADVAKQVMESWTKGREEGAQHAGTELERLNKRIEDERARGRRLEQQLDEQGAELGVVDRAKRSAEMERDSFASQIQKARAEVVAKQALEQEVLSLGAKQDSTERVLKEMQADLDVERRRNRFLRQRLAEHGMGYSEDDPPWRPGLPAGAEDPTAPGRITTLPPSLREEEERIELLIAGRKKMGMSTAALEKQLATLRGSVVSAGAAQPATRAGMNPARAGAPAPGIPAGAAAFAGATGPAAGVGPRQGSATPGGLPTGNQTGGREPRVGWARSAVPPPATVTDDELRAAANRMDAPPVRPTGTQPGRQPPSAGAPGVTRLVPSMAGTPGPTGTPGLPPRRAAPSAPASSSGAPAARDPLTTPATVPPRGAAYGSDRPEVLPPPSVRKRAPAPAKNSAGR